MLPDGLGEHIDLSEGEDAQPVEVRAVPSETISVRPEALPIETAQSIVKHMGLRRPDTPVLVRLSNNTKVEQIGYSDRTGATVASRRSMVALWAIAIARTTGQTITEVLETMEVPREERRELRALMAGPEKRVRDALRRALAIECSLQERDPAPMPDISLPTQPSIRRQEDTNPPRDAKQIHRHLPQRHQPATPAQEVRPHRQRLDATPIPGNPPHPRLRQHYPDTPPRVDNASLPSRHRPPHVMQPAIPPSVPKAQRPSGEEPAQPLPPRVPRPSPNPDPRQEVPARPAPVEAQQQRPGKSYLEPWTQPPNLSKVAFKSARGTNKESMLPETKARVLSLLAKAPPFFGPLLSSFIVADNEHFRQLYGNADAFGAYYYRSPNGEASIVIKEEAILHDTKKALVIIGHEGSHMLLDYLRRNERPRYENIVGNWEEFIASHGGPDFLRKYEYSQSVIDGKIEHYNVTGINLYKKAREEFMATSMGIFYTVKCGVPVEVAFERYFGRDTLTPLEMRKMLRLSEITWSMGNKALGFHSPGE